MNSGMTRKQFLETALWGGVWALVAPRLADGRYQGRRLTSRDQGGRVTDGTARVEAAIGPRGVIADITHSRRAARLVTMPRVACPPGFMIRTRTKRS
jgi:hypothetical protein